MTRTSLLAVAAVCFAIAALIVVGLVRSLA